MNGKVLEQLDRAILAGTGWGMVFETEECGPGHPGSVRLDGRHWCQVPVWVPPGLEPDAVDLWIKVYWDLPVWEPDEIPMFSNNLAWAEQLRAGLIRSGYSVTVKSQPGAARYRVKGPEGRSGCKTVYASDGLPPEVAGPLGLGLAVYHCLYGAEMLGHVENLLVAA